MIELEVLGLEVEATTYRAKWRLGQRSPIFEVKPLEIVFDIAPNPDHFFVFNNLLALTLPILAKEYTHVRVVSPYAYDERLTAYWDTVLRALRIPGFRVEWNTSRNGSAAPLRPPAKPPVTGRPGLLFGGGIESMFALSILQRYDPFLISVVGEQWMNNDLTSNSISIKRSLEDRLVSEHNLDFHRIRSNALSLIRKEETYKHFYVSGLLLYWHSVPLCECHSVGTIYKSSELEEALNFEYQDLSLHPTFLKNAIAEGCPLYLPLFNAYPKIQMLAELAKTPLLPFIYCCYRNTERRWCGECSKCYRISEFCRRLGIDRRSIGMQEGISGQRETGPISRHYWDLADVLYGPTAANQVRVISEADERARVRSWVSTLRRSIGSIRRRLGM